MVAQHYRWDFIGLSTDEKPTPQTSEKVVNGSTYYCSDNSKLYVFYNDTWYEKTVSGGGGTSYTAGSGINISDDTISVDTTTIQEKLTAGVNVSISDNTISATDTTYSNFVGTDGTAAGTAGLVPAPATTDAGKFLKADGTWDTAGGGGVTVVQTIGTSTTDVMSQDATTKLVYGGLGAGVGKAIKIGSTFTTSSSGDRVAISYAANASGERGIAIGRGATASGNGAIALGTASTASSAGEMNIGTTNASYGYNSSNYRLLSGVYDGQSNHDAATVAQGNKLMTTAPTTSDSGVLGQLWTDTTNMHTYQCTAISGDTYTWTQRW